MQMELITVNSVSKAGHFSVLENDLALVDDVTRITPPQGPRRMGCFFFALCVKGHVDYTIDTKHQTVSENQIIIISAGQVLDDIHFSDDCVGRGVFISQQYVHETLSGIRDLSSIFLFSRLHPVFSLERSNIRSVLSFYLLIRQKVNEEKHKFRHDTIRTLLQAFVYDTGNIIWQVMKGEKRKNARAEDIFMQFIQLVEHNFRKERRVGWYATQLAITPKYLSETVRQISKQTPSQWIDKYVILEMRVLLKNSKRPIKEIAETLHFPNQSFMGKYFKEHVGMSPREYRNS